MATVCITGASRGIGNGFARAYLEHGHTVIAAGRDPDTDTARALASEYPDRAHIVAMDVADDDSVEQARRRIEETVDAVDVLINNAGIAKAPDERAIEDIDTRDMQEVFNVNTLGPVRVTRALFPLLRKSAAPKVIMMSSSAGSIAGQGGGRGVPYCVSKAALNMLTKLLTFYCKPEGVLIAALHPGWVRTELAGSGAPLTVEESVASMMELISRLSAASPVYMDYRGNEMPC